MQLQPQHIQRDVDSNLSTCSAMSIRNANINEDRVMQLQPQHMQRDVGSNVNTCSAMSIRNVNINTGSAMSIRKRDATQANQQQVQISGRVCVRLRSRW
jgi:uncharacterized protein with gpF-like domain